jgi:hypothetical protein
MAEREEEAIGAAGEAHCQGGGSSRGGTATRRGGVRRRRSSCLRGQSDPSIPPRAAASGVGGGCGPVAIRTCCIGDGQGMARARVAQPKGAASTT